MERVITCNLNDNFIGKIAGYVEENFLKQGKDLSRLAFVFGGKRPSIFLKKELSKKIKKSFFTPHFFSIDEFVEYALSKKEYFIKISDLDACFIIYKLACDIAPDILKARESFSKFLPWAREIISFFDQLDLEDIRIESLRSIQEKARIGYDVPENINIMLSSIISLREAYHNALRNINTYSRGFMYLLASRYIQDIAFTEFDNIFFCGLFYLHKTEQEILKNIYDNEKGVLFVQGDGEEWSGCNFTLQAGFDVHSQACLVRETIKQIKKTQGLDETVIVLPNPDNIIPLLSEISSEVGDFNVSMGYPLKRSALYSLFECIFKAQGSQKDGAYYTKDYLKVLAHPLAKNLKILENPSVTRVLTHKIEEILLGIEKTSLGGSLFIKLCDIRNSRELYDSALKTMKNMEIEVSYDELKEVVAQLNNLLFVIWENIHNFYDFSLNLKTFLEALINKSFLSGYPLNLKMAEKIFSIQEELVAASFNKEPFPGEDIFKIFENKLESEMISFSGSPLKGLQVLGLFETRSLSFENVIIMDMNEAALPSLKIYEPLIPREVMINLGLNRLEKEEEIQRYHFRRLISGAKNAHLIYQQRNDKEKSRFLEELIWERQKKLDNLDAVSIPLASFKVKVLPKRLEIKKNADTVKFLKEFEYSASSVNTYLSCPLRFYYQYVLGLKEKESLLDEPEAADIGSFIHELLEETFSEFIGRRPCIDQKFKAHFFKVLDKKFADEFQKKMKSDSFLIKEMLDFRMRRFLDNEKMRNACEIISLERTFKTQIKLTAGNFKFKAVVDRIDRLGDGSVMVLDYKTGSADIMPLDAERIAACGFSRENLKNTVRSFQLPLYLYIVGNDKRYKDKKINAALYSLKEIYENFGLHKLFKKDEQLADKDKIMDIFLKALDALLCDIINPAVVFKADDENEHQCSTCPFFYLCR